MTGQTEVRHHRSKAPEGYGGGRYIVSPNVVLPHKEEEAVFCQVLILARANNYLIEAGLKVNLNFHIRNDC